MTEFALPLAELKARVDLRQVVAQFWGRPDRQRSAYDVYASRWRDDGSRPAFTVYPTHFKDYGGSGVGGDVYDFLVQELNVGFPQAVAWLNAYLGGAHREGSAPLRSAAHSSAHSDPPPAEWQHAARQVLERAQRSLWKNPEALAYLHARGLSDETIIQAGYGYLPSWTPVEWQNPETGRIVYLAPGIVEPWQCDGVLWALRVRCRVEGLARALGIPDDSFEDGQPSPKYLNLAGSRQSGALYNGDALYPGADVLLVEGGFDARLAQQVLGDQVVVVTLGSATNMPTARRLEQLRQAGRVFLLLDADEAGQQAQERLVEMLADLALPVRLPTGKDVTDFVLDGGDLPGLLERAGRALWWPEGLPDTLRSALLAYFRPTTAPVIEMLNRAVNSGQINPAQFTMDALLLANVSLGFGIAEGSLRRIIAELEGCFVEKCETINSPGAGRPAQTYRLLPLKDIKQNILAWAAPRIYEKHHPAQGEQGIVARPTPSMLVALGFDAQDAALLAEKLDVALERVYRNQQQQQLRAGASAFRALARLANELEELHSTPLPEGWPLASATEFRAAFLRATNDPETRRSRREIRELLGVANGSVDVMVKRAGLEKAEKTGAYQMVAIQSPNYIDRQVRRITRELRAYPLSVLAFEGNKPVVERAYLGRETQAYIVEQMGQGRQVMLKVQMPNRYVEASAEPPVLPATKPASDKPAPPYRLPPVAQTSPPAAAPVYGPDYDPLWVRRQLLLAAFRAGRLASQPPYLVDLLTGELLEPEGGLPDGRSLLALLLPTEILPENKTGPDEWLDDLSGTLV